jgi:GNAT superfamily N-acetyltransferase
LKQVTTGSEVTIRPWRQEDRGEVLRLLTASLGGGPSGSRQPDFFEWKHRANPFGRSLLLVAEADHRIVGLRAFLRWTFRLEGRSIHAVRAVDTATHPDFQGQGIFSKLTMTALDALGEEAELVFNTPNEKSLPGYLKMGWIRVGTIRVLLRVRRPLRVLGRGWGRVPVAPVSRDLIGGVPAAEFLGNDDALTRLLEAEDAPRGRLRTARTLEYLRWRYVAPSLDYRAVVRERAGQVLGAAIFRVRVRGSLSECTIADLLVPAGDVRTARGLLSDAARAYPVDHAACSFPLGSTARRGARACGFLPAPGGITLAARALRSEPFEVGRSQAWFLSLGDLEVF